MSRRHAFWVAGLSTAVLATGCATGQVPEVQRLQAQAAYERGIKHLEDGEAASALAALREAVALNGRVAVYRDTLGLVYLDLLQRPDLAIDELRQAVLIDPNLADAHFHLGTALAESRNWAEAIASYRRALVLPTSTVPHMVHQNLGIALFNLKRYREAEESLRFALALEPALGMAYYNLGLLFLAEGRKEEAKRVLERAQELGADSPLAEAARERLKGLGEGG